MFAELLINADGTGEVGAEETRARQEQTQAFLAEWPARRLAPFVSAPGVIHLSRLDRLADEQGHPALCEVRR